MSRTKGERVRLEEVGALGTVLMHQHQADGVLVRWDDGKIENVSGSFLWDAPWDSAALDLEARLLEDAGWTDEADERDIGAYALREAARTLGSADV